MVRCELLALEVVGAGAENAASTGHAALEDRQKGGGGRDAQSASWLQRERSILRTERGTQRATWLRPGAPRAHRVGTPGSTMCCTAGQGSG